MSVSSISEATMNFFKKRLRLFGIMLCALGLSIVGIGVYYGYFCADRQFTLLCEELSRAFYSSDALSLAFTFREPPETETLLPFYDREDYLNSSGDDFLKRLAKINPKRLNDENVLLYDILEDYLSRHEGEERYLYLEQPLSPTGGVQTNLPVLLAEYPVEDKEDIETYLDILEAVPDYLKSLGDYATDQKAAGYLMATDDINEVIAQCDAMRSDSGYQLFTEGFANLLANSGSFVTEAEQDVYTAECDRIVTTMIFPAYEALGDTLLLLREEDIPRQGLYHIGMADYYAHLLSIKTGSSRPVAEIEKMLQKRFEKLAGQYNALLTLVAANPPKKELGVIQGEPDSLLLYLQDTLQAYFPELPEHVTSAVHSVPECLLPYTAPAYYFTPRVDDYYNNAIYMNEADITDDLSCLTTLAHEGYPGHMLQATYFLSHQDAAHTPTPGGMSLTEQNALRCALNYIGYIEGWAMYVELYSYDYAAGKDASSDEMTDNYLKLLRVNRELKICLYCLLDIRVNYYGENAEDIAPYLVNIGITDNASIQAVYAYLVNEPATYASYYVGFLELLECKKLYEKYCDAAGMEYSDKAFHTFYLDCGPCSFSHIKKRMESEFESVRTD